MTQLPEDWAEREAARMIAAGGVEPSPEPFNFPQPGERLCAGGIVLTEREACALLADSAMAYAAIRCPDPDCDNCNRHRALWWNVCNALSREARIVLQAWLVHRGYPLPDAPWEEVDG